MSACDADFYARSRAPGHFTIIAWATRPGALRFLTALEWGHFTPGTRANDDFQLAVLDWINLPWWIAVMPEAAEATAAHIAEEHGMRIANGVPRRLLIRGLPAMGATRSKLASPFTVLDSFPIDHSRAYTLENAKGSPLHDPAGEAFLRAEERRWLDAFWAARGGRPPH